MSKSSRGPKAGFTSLTGGFGSKDDLTDSQKKSKDDAASSEELGPFKHDSEKDYDQVLNEIIRQNEELRQMD